MVDFFQVLVFVVVYSRIDSYEFVVIHNICIDSFCICILWWLGLFFCCIFHIG